MNNILSDFEHVFSSAVHILNILCARLCVPGQSSYTSIFTVYTERRVGVSCSVYDILHADAKGYIIMCKYIYSKTCILSLLRTDIALEYWLCRWYSATNFTAFTKLLNTMYKHSPSNTC